MAIAAESTIRAISRINDLEGALDQLEYDIHVVNELMDRFPLPLIVGNGESWKYVSRTFASALGWTREDMEARPFMWFIHPEDRSAVAAEMQRVLRDQNVGTIIARFQHKDGRYFRVLWRWSPPGPKSKLTWMLGQVRGEG